MGWILAELKREKIDGLAKKENISRKIKLSEYNKISKFVKDYYDGINQEQIILDAIREILET